MVDPVPIAERGSRRARGLAAAALHRIRALLFSPRSVEYWHAVLGAIVVVGAGVVFGGVLPFAIALLALVGGAAWVRSAHPKLSAFGVGTMVGSIAACWTGVEQMQVLRLGPAPGPWMLGVYFVLVGVCVGWMMHAAGQRMPLGDARSIAKRVAEFLAYPTSILTAVVTFTAGVPTARTVGGTIAVGAASAALAVGLGLWIGDQVAEHFHATQAAQEQGANPDAA